MIKDDEMWVALSKYLVSLLKIKYKEKHGLDKFEYEDMVNLLAKNDIQISNVALRKKVSRGRFSAQFLLQLIISLDVDLSSREIKDVLRNSRVVVELINKANANKKKGGNGVLIRDMLSVTMNLIDVSGNYPSITDIGHAALIFPYRRSFSSAVVGKLPENDIFTLSLFDELPAQEKELVMKDFEMFLFSTGQSIK